MINLIDVQTTFVKLKKVKQKNVAEILDSWSGGEFQAYSTAGDEMTPAVADDDEVFS